MWIIIDTTESGVVRLYYAVSTTWLTSIVPASDALRVLGAVHSVLAEHNFTAQDLRGIGFVQGKGTFTATRVAATITNTLSYALGIPGIGIDAAPSGAPEELFSGHTGTQVVTPRYSAPPSIGKKK